MSFSASCERRSRLELPLDGALYRSLRNFACMAACHFIVLFADRRDRPQR